MNCASRHSPFSPKHLSLAIDGLVLALLTSISSCSSPEKSPTEQAFSLQAARVRETSQSLRRAIDGRYKKLVEARQIKPIGQGGNSIADVLQEFIPIGTSFEQATAILQAAGFVVGKPQKSVSSSAEVVIAKIDPYIRSLFGFAGTTSIVVVLEPSDPSDWKSVGRLEAEVVASFL